MVQDKDQRETNMRGRTIAMGVLVVAFLTLAFMLGRAWSRQREWFDLQHRQMATIQRLERLPPGGTTAHEWREHIVMLNNLWGNVLNQPSSTGGGNEEMRKLQATLEDIVGQTSAENSVGSVDQIYEILLPRAKDRRFVSVYRDEFRAAFGERSLSSIAGDK